MSFQRVKRLLKMLVGGGLLTAALLVSSATTALAIGTSSKLPNGKTFPDNLADVDLPTSIYVTSGLRSTNCKYDWNNDILSAKNLAIAEHHNVDGSDFDFQGKTNETYAIRIYSDPAASTFDVTELGSKNNRDADKNTGSDGYVYRATFSNIGYDQSGDTIDCRLTCYYLKVSNKYDEDDKNNANGVWLMSTDPDGAPWLHAHLVMSGTGKIATWAPYDDHGERMEQYYRIDFVKHGTSTPCDGQFLFRGADLDGWPEDVRLLANWDDTLYLHPDTWCSFNKTGSDVTEIADSSTRNESNWIRALGRSGRSGHQAGGVESKPITQAQTGFAIQSTSSTAYFAWKGRGCHTQLDVEFVGTTLLNPTITKTANQSYVGIDGDSSLTYTVTATVPYTVEKNRPKSITITDTLPAIYETPSASAITVETSNVSNGKINATSKWTITVDGQKVKLTAKSTNCQDPNNNGIYGDIKVTIPVKTRMQTDYKSYGSLKKVTNEATVSVEPHEGSVQKSLDAKTTLDTEVRYGYLKLSKSSSNTSVSAAWRTYSLAGAVFGVYKDSACTQYMGAAYDLTTDANGATNTVMLSTSPQSTYYIKEKTAPKGYKKNTTVFSQGLTTYATATKAVSDEPVYGDVPFPLRKLDPDEKTNEPQGNASFTGATYLVGYYDEYLTLADLEPSGAVAERDGNGLKKDANGYYIQRSPKMSATFSTDSSGRLVFKTASPTSGSWTAKVGGNNVFPLGTITIKETTAPTGYQLDGVTHIFCVKHDAATDTVYIEKLTNTYVNDTSGDYDTREGPVQRGGVSIKKIDADWKGTSKETETQGDVDSFDGIEYSIYNLSSHYVYVNETRYAPTTVAAAVAGTATPVTRITTDSNGVATTGNNFLPYGRYVVIETKSVDGYLIASDWANGSVIFDITAEGFMKYYGTLNDAGNVEGTPNADPVVRSGIVIHKYDADLLAQGQGANGATQGNAASFAGTRYVITSLSPHDVNVIDASGKHTDYSYDQRCYYLTAGADGIARTNVDALPYGTYSVMELSPAPGYQNSYWKQEFEIRKNGTAGVITFNDAPDGEHPRNEDEIDRGSLTIAKVDAETGLNTPQGDATLAGTVYTIVNRSDSQRAVVVDNKIVPYGAVAKTITSQANGIATTGSQSLPYGTYEVRETTAPGGYQPNDGWAPTFTIDHNGHDMSLIYDGNKNRDTVRRLTTQVRVRKVDADYKDDGASGAAGLSGATFYVRNASANPVLVREGGRSELVAPGEVCMTLVTDATGCAWIVANSLPVGTYEITEEYAPTGYTRNATWSATLKVAVDGTPSVTEVVCEDPVIRGDLKFRKVASGTSAPLAGVAFRIRSTTTGEAHIAITDSNGLLDTSSSAANRESGNANKNDAAVSYDNISGSYAVDSDAIEAGYGIWFAGRDGGSVAPTNSVGALPYDTYEVEELRCDANRDFDLVPPFTFTVSREGYALSSETVEDAERTPPSVPGEHGNRVTVYKDAEPAPNTKVKPGDVIAYKVIVRNTGATPQAWTLVRDAVPAGTDYVAGSASDGGVVAVGGDGAYIEWKVAAIQPREERTLTFKATVRYDAPQFVANTALVGEMPTDFTPGDPSNPTPTEESNTVYHRTGSTPTPAFVRVTKSAEPAPGKQVAWRTDIRYVLHVENTGGTAALMTGVFDRVPHGTEFVEVESGEGYYYDLTGTDPVSGVGWLVPVIAPGESVDLSFTVRVSDRSAVRNLSVVENQASWGDLSALDFPAPPQNDLSNTTNIVEHPLYEGPYETSDTYKSSEPPSESVVAAGETITYTLTTTNGLVRTKPYVLVRDYVPEHTAYVEGSATDGGTYVAANAEGNSTGRAYVEWVLTNVAPREERKVSFTVRATESWQSYVRNVAYSQTYDSPVFPGDPANPQPSTRTNEVKHRSAVSTEPEDKFPLVMVVKSSDPVSGATVVPGEEVSYTLAVTNNGQATAYDVMVWDGTPEGTSLVAVDAEAGEGIDVSHTLPSQGAGAGWLIRSLGIGQTATLTMRVKVDSGADVSLPDVIRNQARWSYENEPDEYEDWLEPPLSGDDMGNETNVIEHRTAPAAPPQLGSFVTVYKSSEPAPNSVVKEGDEIEYRVTARNTGAATQPATLVRDYIPDGTEYVEGSATDGGVYVSAEEAKGGRAYVEWVIGALSPLEEARVSFAVEVTDGYRAYIQNVGYCDRTQRDTRPGDPSNPEPGLPSNTVWHTTDETKPTPAAVEVVKEAEPPAGSTVTRDDVIHYVLHVTNTGGSTSGPQGVWDKVPDGMEVVEGSVSEEFSGTLVSPEEGDPYVAWLIPSLDAGKTVDLSFDVRMKSGMVDDAIRNQATWGESETLPEGPLGNTSNMVEHLVSRSPEPHLKKEVLGASRVSLGDVMEFTIKVTNDGDAEMAGWSLTDIPSEKMSYVSDDSHGIVRDDGSVFWKIDLLPGESRVVKVKMRAVAASGLGSAKNVAMLSDVANNQYGISEAEVVIIAPAQVLLQTGIGTISGLVGTASAALLAYDAVQRRKMRL